MTQPMASEPNMTARPMHPTATRLISSIGALGSKLADNVRALRPYQITLRRMCRLDVQARNFPAQQAIPSEASLVHGITDADVDGAGSFPDAWAQFQEFVGDRILVGHSIGFDLAVLERECRRARLPWKKPRALCVRLLATIANPNLADHSLETIAGWLRLEITGRHSALGDAIAAGDIFAALIPELRKRNIRTLGEAEVACLALSDAL
ncbi:MAG: 3'-5' exonuclease, partial [Mesorhizobium sp.]